MKLCDLHTHSTCSDGKVTPAKLVEMALEIGLAGIALCDHNTVSGLPAFLEAAKGQQIEAIAGIEFSVNYGKKEYHLLALGIPESRFQEVAELTRWANEQKEKSNMALVEAINRDGYALDYDKLKAMVPNGVFNRSHVAEELTRLGYTESKKQAFATLLEPDYGYYREPERLMLLDVIPFVKSIGAVPVLAHPFLKTTAEELEEVMPLAKEKGLVGMECYYSEYDAETTEKALEMADKYGLKYSGGSDFHGSAKPHVSLGVGTGNLQIPYRWWLDMKPTR